MRRLYAVSPLSPATVILLLLNTITTVNGFHVDVHTSTFKSVGFVDPKETLGSELDPRRIPFCNEIRQEVPSTIGQCRRELRQHSPAEFGAILDTVLEDFEENVAPCLRQLKSCQAGKLLDFILVDADQPVVFPYWDYRLDVDSNSSLIEFLRESHRFIVLSRFMDEDLAQSVRNFTESKLAGQTQLATTTIDNRSSGLDAGQVLRMLLAISIDEQLEQRDSKFDKVQCEAAGRSLRWDLVTGHCFARAVVELPHFEQSLTTTTVSNSIKIVQETSNDEAEKELNRISATDDQPLNDTATYVDFGSTTLAILREKTLSTNGTINDEGEMLNSFSKQSTDETINANLIEHSNGNDNELKTTNDFNKNLAISNQGYHSIVSASENINGDKDDYDPDVDEFVMNLVLSAVQSRKLSADIESDTIKMVVSNFNSVNSANNTVKNEINPVDALINSTILIEATTTPITALVSSVLNKAVHAPATNTMSSRQRQTKNKSNKKHRKHKKSKKIPTTTTTTTTVATSTLIDDEDWDTKTTIIASNYWPKKKSGYYKFDRKYLSKYRTPTASTIADKYQSPIETVTLDGSWNAMTDKNSNGKYVFDTKYNFPEEKSTYNNRYGSKNVEKLDHGSDSRQGTENTINVTFDSATDYRNPPESSYYISSTINTLIDSVDVDDENHLDRLLKYLPKPKLPKGTIRWRSHNVPIPMAYFTITAIQGALSRQRRQPSTAARKRVAGAQIYVTGLNMPTGYTQITEGHQLKGSSAVVLRTLNPRSSGPFVEFKVRVVNKYGRTCRQLCLDDAQRYRRCTRKALRLSTYRRFSDPIPFYPSAMDAIDGQWTGRGYYRRRKPDYLLFRCD